MKIPTILLTLFILVLSGSTMIAQNGTPVATSAKSVVTESKGSSIDSTVLFLLKAAANDFHANRPPDPARFRNVHFSKIINPGNKDIYLLCGEFQTSQPEDKMEWIPFATIKTSGYEQWIGDLAVQFCKKSSVIKSDDLSLTLKNLLDSIK